MIVENNFETRLNNWVEQEKAAFELVSVIGHLCFSKNVELVFLRRPLVDISARELANLHSLAHNITQLPLTVEVTHQLIKEINLLDLGACKIDVGTLSTLWLQEKDTYASHIPSFLKDKLGYLIDQKDQKLNPKDVILYGFGRIGRLLAREMITQAGRGEQLRLKAIVTRSNSDDDIIKRASLLRKDSVHGRLKGVVEEDLANKTLIANGHTIHMIAANNPAEIDYESYGIKDALVIDNTGAWRDREGLSNHLKAKGTKHVLLTAPGKGDLCNIVLGVNHKKVNLKEEKIFSAASCTTNAICPIIKIIHDAFGIEQGHVETVHSYTNDQNLLDNFHKKFRRGRAAPLNMVITETGAAKAASKVIPEMKDKLTGNAVRVPTPDVSLAILKLQLSKETSLEEINETVKKHALEGDLVQQIEYSVSNELVSSDLIGNSHASIFDSKATIVSNDKKSIVLYVWYDNEYGYSRQVFGLAKYISEVRRPIFY